MHDARDLLEALRPGPVPAPHGNRLMTLIAQGDAPLEAVGILAAEERHIVAADRRSFLTLAARAGTGPTGDFFAFLAQGELPAPRPRRHIAAMRLAVPIQLVGRH